MKDGYGFRESTIAPLLPPSFVVPPPSDGSVLEEHADTSANATEKHNEPDIR
ncbi:MAG: hypothetical protein NVS3B10_20000 [Polyangiales bacterium]